MVNFTDRRMAVMMMHVVDSATARCRGDCSFVEMVRASAMAVTDEVVVVEDTFSNSLILAIQSNPSSASAVGSPVAQLLQIAREVIAKVCNPLKCSGVRWLHLKVFNAIQV